MIDKEYDVPTMTRKEHEKMIDNALALSTLDAPEPTRKIHICMMVFPFRIKIYLLINSRFF
ncbi:MAG TPA: hypothetical protein DEQ64_09790 [Lachnoclostridium sp.]|uniref:hypothetical protein n=2 Tax=Lacrimispora sp. TaxID=2719234 RepID=UPI000EBFA459|nr:hypothetical protein [Lacrimispora sp.]HCD44008.1 hypothetical protein [Lachnoclostridium sp.]